MDDITLSSDQSKIFGLLGPNGAGKTTLVRLLATLIKADRGTAKVLGIDVAKNPNQARRIIGLAGQYASIDTYLTGYQNLYMFGRLYRLSKNATRNKAKKLLEEFSLAEAGNLQASKYSGGMRRRLDLAASLMGSPKVLFLDEPTTGLDPKARLDLWLSIENLAKAGTTIVLTTQYMEEADRLADQLAIIDRGKVIAEGTSSSLKRTLGGDVVELELTNEQQKQQAKNALRSFEPADTADKLGLKIRAENGSKLLVEAINLLSEYKINPVNIAMHSPSLDDVFLKLTGKRTQENKNE